MLALASRRRRRKTINLAVSSPAFREAGEACVTLTERDRLRLGVCIVPNRHRGAMADLEDLEDIGGASAADGTRMTRDLPPVVRVTARNPKPPVTIESPNSTNHDDDTDVRPSDTFGDATADRVVRGDGDANGAGDGIGDEKKLSQKKTRVRPIPIDQPPAPRPFTYRPSGVRTTSATPSSWPVSWRRTGTP